MTNRRLAFLGLGVMGFPMAGHLAKAGHAVTVYNRTREKAGLWLERHGAGNDNVRQALTPAAAAEGADIVFACVGADRDAREIALGAEGCFAAMKPGAVFVDHTTTSAALARELAAEASARGLGFLDAPVSGGQAGAENGTLTVMIGGMQGDYAKAEPVLSAYAKMQRLLGPAGSGQLAKMVNQICIAATVQGLSEALNFALAAGLDADAVVDVISKGAAQSWQMDNRAGTMIRGAFDFGFAVDWMRKDLGFVFEEARALGVSVPVTALIDQFYADVQTIGGGRQDTSSLIRRFRR